MGSRHPSLSILGCRRLRTIVGHEGSDLLAVLDELNTHALTHCRVGLLRLDTDLLENDPLGVRAASERLCPLLAQVTTLVALVRPVVVLAFDAELATRAKSVRLTCISQDRQVSVGDLVYCLPSSLHPSQKPPAASLSPEIDPPRFHSGLWATLHGFHANPRSKNPSVPLSPSFLAELPR